MTRTLLRSVLATTAAIVLLAGCGAAEPGAAAVVDGRRISVSDVQSATVQAQTWAGPGSQVTQQQVLWLLAVAPYVQAVATRYQAGTSVDDARQVLSSKVPDPSPATLAVMRAVISLNKVQQQFGESRTASVVAEASSNLAKDGFTVNPRFGGFDPRSGQLVPLQPNWLVGSQPSAGSSAPAQQPTSPTPSPTPSQ